MKLFLKRSLYFGLVVLILLVSWEFFLRNFSNTYDIKKELIDVNQSQVEVFFLGTSHSFSGINPREIDRPALNLANNSQSLYYDIRILEESLDDLPALKTVVFEVNFFSFFYNLDKGPEAWRNVFYYQSFGIDAQTEQLSLLDLSRSYQLKRNELVLLMESQEQNKTYFDALGFAGAETDRKELTEAAAHKKFLSFSNDYINEESEYLINRLSNLLDQLEDRNINVVIIQTPVSSFLSSYIKKSEYLNKTNQILNQLEKQYDITHLNYLYDERFNDELFQDADHLSIEGSKLLTFIVNEDLRGKTSL